MGLLDDAIREHLDLKRRTGADPAEVERMEREALGPVRRERLPQSEPDAPGVDEIQARAAPTPLHPDEDEGAEPYGFDRDDNFERHEQPRAPEPRAAQAFDDEELLPELEVEPPEVDEEYEDDYEEPRRGLGRGFLRRRRKARAEREEFDDEFEEHDDLLERHPLDDHPLDQPYEDEPFDDEPFPAAPRADSGFGDGTSEDEPLAEEISREQPPPSPAPARPAERAAPPNLRFDSAPPKRPRFGDLPGRTPEPDDASGADHEQGVPASPHARERATDRPPVDPDATMVHRLPDAEHFPEDDEADSPGPHHGDPLEDRLRHVAQPTVEHDMSETFANEDVDLPARRPQEAPRERPPEPSRSPEPGQQHRATSERRPDRPRPESERPAPERERRPVEPERRSDAPEPEEDLLEETPDFLQDTPDHDRLWFEQRPPRDFDFDG